MNRCCFTIAALTVGLLAGCAIGPNYQRPALDTPATFRGQAAVTTNSLAELPWWELFQDPQLQALISAGLTNNFSLRIATARVLQARELAAQTRAAFFPSVNYGGLATRLRSQAFANPVFSVGTADLTAYGAGASWEVDLWGRVRRLNEAGRARYLASQEAARGVRLSLVSDIAQAYFELLELDLELAVSRRTTNSFARSLELFTARREGGLVSRLETARAVAALANATAAVPELERRIAIQENLLNVLVGHAPGPVRRGPALTAQALPPTVPAGLPSQLLARRPDLGQAEALLRAANADIGVTMADFLPRLDLSGALGRISPELTAFNASTGNAWALAAMVTGPLFEGGRLVARHREAIQRWEEAKLRYEQAVLGSLQEVADLLVTREKVDATRAAREQAVQALAEAVEISQQRYADGKASYYEVLEAQQQLFPSEISLARTRLEQYATVIQLYRALGGGWQTPAP